MKNRKMPMFMAMVITCTEVMGSGLPVFASDEWAYQEETSEISLKDELLLDEEEETEEFETSAEEAAPSYTEEAVQDDDSALAWDEVIIDEESFEETKEEGVQYLAAGEYVISFKDLRGDGESWIYTDEKQTLSLDTQALAEAGDYKLEWKFGYAIEDGFQELEQEAFLSVSEDGSEAVIDGAGLKEALPEGQEVIEVRVAAIVEEEEVGNAAVQLEMREPICEYQFPEQSITVNAGDSWEFSASLTCHVENADHPSGEDVEVAVTAVSTETVDGAEDALVCEQKEDESGWILRANSYGHAVVALTYNLIDDTQSEEPYQVDVWINDDIWNMELESSSGSSYLLQASSLDLTAKIDHKVYDESNGLQDADANVVCEWESDSDGWADAITLLQDEENGNICHIAAKADLENDKDVHILVTAYLLGEDGEKLFNEETGNYISVTTGDILLHVRKTSFKLQPDELETYSLEPGAEIVVSPKLEITYSGEEGEEITEPMEEENIRYRWEWDPTAVEIKDVEETVLGQEEDGSDTYGSAPFILKKLENVQTVVKLIAEVQDSEGTYREADSKEWTLEELEYNISFENLRGENSTWIYTNETQILCVNTEELADRDNYTLEWKFGYWNDSVFQELDTEKEFYEVKEDPSEAIIYGSILKEALTEDNDGIDVSVTVKVNGIEVGGTSTWLSLREPEYKYSYVLSQPGDNEMLLGDSIWVGKWDASCWVKDQYEPEGADVDLEIQGIEITGFERWNEEDGAWEATDDAIIRLEEDEDGKGWNLAGQEYGRAIVTVTYSPIREGMDPEVQENLYVFVNADAYDLSLYYQNNSDQMLPESLMMVTTGLSHSWKYSEYDQGEETVYDYRLQIETDDQGNPCYDTDVIRASVSEDEQGLVIESLTQEGDTDILVSFSCPEIDEEGNLTYISKGTKNVHVHVTNCYYVWDPEELLTETGEIVNPSLGEQLNLADYDLQVYRIEAGAEGRVPEENIRICIDLKSLDQDAWSVLEGTEDQDIPVLLRTGNWDTDVRVYAEKNEADENEAENWVEFTDWQYHIPSVDYYTDLEVSYGSRWNMWMFTNAPLTLAMVADERLEDLAYKTEWDVKVYREDELVDPAEYVLSEVSDDEKTITLTALDGDQSIHFEVQAVISYNNHELGRQDITINVQEPQYFYNYILSQPGDNEMLVGNSILVGSSDADCWVQDRYNTWGGYEQAEIQSIEIEEQQKWNEKEGIWEAADDVIVALNENESETGKSWNLKGEAVGRALLKVTYAPIREGMDPVIQDDLEIYVSSDVYYLTVNYPNNSDQMLPESEMVVTTSLQHKWKGDDEDGEEAVQDYRLEIATDELYQEPFYDTNLISAEVTEDGKGIQINSFSNGWDTTITVNYKIPQMDRAGNYVTDETGEIVYQQVGSYDVYVNVNYNYKNILADQMLLGEGDTASADEIGAVLMQYDAEEGQDGTEIEAKFYVRGLSALALEYGISISEDGKTLTVPENIFETMEEDPPLVLGLTLGARYNNNWDEEETFEVSYPFILHQHQWTDTRTEPTCTKAGSHVHTCEICGKTETEVLPAKGHTPGAWKVTKAATCSTAGTQTQYCSVCNVVLATKAIPATGNHSWSAWKVTKAATTTQGGTETRKCSVCGKIETRATAKLPYDEKGDPNDTTSVAGTENAIMNTSSKDEDIKDSSYGMLQAQAKKVTKTAITIKWNKVSGASGYIVYGAQCGQKSTQLYKGTKLTYKQSKLKKGTYYKYTVVAYKVANGQQKVIASSKTLHIATAGGKVGNYSSVKVNKKNVTLKTKKTFKIKATAVKSSAKLKVKKHRALKYESSNPAVATVSSKGVIKAKSKGTCTIYVYTQNGKCAKIKVKVK